MSPICGKCGKNMKYTRIAPCFDCGARPNEMDEYEKGNHQFFSFPLFDHAIFCDFCINDIESTDLELWGFPPEFDWQSEGEPPVVIPREKVKTSMGWICPNCFCTENQQKFVVKNANRNGQTLPNLYWKYLSEEGAK